MQGNAKNFAAGIVAGILGLLGVPAAFAESSPDAKFLTEAIRDDVGDIKLAELAQQRGQDRAVRQLGELLEAQQTATMQEAASLAGELDVIPPTQPSVAATKKHEALSKLSGAEFDRAFIAEVIESCEQEIAKFSAHAESGDSKVTELAAYTLPVLKEHLAKAETLRTELFAATGGG
jgi:putative membrane protein